MPGYPRRLKPMGRNRFMARLKPCPFEIVMTYGLGSAALERSHPWREGLVGLGEGRKEGTGKTGRQQVPRCARNDNFF